MLKYENASKTSKISHPGVPSRNLTESTPGLAVGCKRGAPCFSRLCDPAPCIKGQLGGPTQHHDPASGIRGHMGGSTLCQNKGQFSASPHGFL